MGHATRHSTTLQTAQHSTALGALLCEVPMGADELSFLVVAGCRNAGLARAGVGNVAYETFALPHVLLLHVCIFHQHRVIKLLGKSYRGLGIWMSLPHVKSHPAVLTSSSIGNQQQRYQQ